MRLLWGFFPAYNNNFKNRIPAHSRKWSKQVVSIEQVEAASISVTRCLASHDVLMCLQ